MPLPPGVRRIFAALPGSRARVAADVDDELAFHIDMCVRDLAARGLDPAAAQLEAARRFGDIEFTRHYCRDEDRRRDREARQAMTFGELRQDFSYALRALRAARGFTVVALLTLAIGIGATTAVFSVVRGVLLAPLPFAEPERVQRIWSRNTQDAQPRGPVSENDFLDFRAAAKQWSSMAGWFYVAGGSSVDLTGTGAPEQLSGAYVTDDFFETLRVPALVGRWTRREEHVAGADRVVVLSHGVWQRRFGGDPGIVGTSLTLAGEPYVVVGVMPPRFTFPAERLDVWMPLSRLGEDDIPRRRENRFLGVIGRLAPGATEASAVAELDAIAGRLAREHPENERIAGVTVVSLHEALTGDVRRPLLVLLGAVGFLLLLTCANLAGLLLARGSTRERELAVRAALGAGRGRITRQLFTENVVLALLGGALGLFVAWVGVRLLARYGAGELPRADDIRIDAPVLLFALGASLLSGLLFGLVPALRSATRDLRASLAAGARGSTGTAGQRLRSALVVAEVALALVLAAGAGLATRSFSRMLDVNPGFDTERVLAATMSLNLGDPTMSEEEFRRTYPTHYATVLERVRAVPGVESVGAAKFAPLGGEGEPRDAWATGSRYSEADPLRSSVMHVTPGYFRTLGIPLLSGRDFEMSERIGSPLVFIVNASFAKAMFPDGDAVGRTINVFGQPFPIVGVVGDVRQRSLTEPAAPMMYISQLQNPRSRVVLFVRSAGDPLQLVDEVREAVWSVNRNQTFTEIAPFATIVGETVARPRLLAALLALFGAVGLSLAALGIYGVLAFAVAQRRQEIGVRIALGATPAQVMRLVLGRGLVLAAAGASIGLLAALSTGRVMRTVLYETSAADPVTLVVTTLLLLAVALVASMLPARRALRIDPGVAMRPE